MVCSRRPRVSLNLHGISYASLVEHQGRPLANRSWQWYIEDDMYDVWPLPSLASSFRHGRLVFMLPKVQPHVPITCRTERADHKPHITCTLITWAASVDQQITWRNKFTQTTGGPSVDQLTTHNLTKQIHGRRSYGVVGSFPTSFRNKVKSSDHILHIRRSRSVSV